MPDWKMKRGNDEYPVGDVATLQQWAKTGRVFPTDYVFNPTLGKWIYAKDCEEIAGVMKERSGTSKVGLAFVLAAILMVVIGFWPIGILFFLIGAVAIVVKAVSR